MPIKIKYIISVRNDQCFMTGRVESSLKRAKQWARSNYQDDCYVSITKVEYDPISFYERELNYYVKKSYNRNFKKYQ